VIIEVAVGGSDEMLGDSITEQNVGHAVLYIVNSALIESLGGGGVVRSVRTFRKKHTEKDECPVVVELWVCKERWKESVNEGSSKSDVGIVTIIRYVYS
jgi:hypothetical protein